MLAYGLEYCDVDLRIDGNQVQQFLRELELREFWYSIEENQESLFVRIKCCDEEVELLFRKLGEFYKLRSKNIRISDEQLADLFQKTLTTSKGHAIMKKISPDYLLIQNIQFGEPVRITEISGHIRKVLLDKEGAVTIQQVIEAFKRKDAEIEAIELRNRLDRELQILYEHMLQGNQEEIEHSKKRLEVMRKEMLRLEI